jgi:hypothetical protein
MSVAPTPGSVVAESLAKLGAEDSVQCEQLKFGHWIGGTRYHQNAVGTETGCQAVTWNRNASDLFAGKWLQAPATTCRQTAS